MLCNQKFFGRMVNKKCLVGEIRSYYFENRLNYCEARRVDNNNDDDDDDD